MRQAVTYTSQERVKQVLNELLAKRTFFCQFYHQVLRRRALHPDHYFFFGKVFENVGRPQSDSSKARPFF